MKRTLLSAVRALPGAALLAVLGACADVTEPTVPSVLDDPAPQASLRASADAQALTVYSQNVYLGGDTGPIFTLDLSNLPAVLQATNVFWAQVKASDVPARAAEIAAEIDRARPHLVGLQEVFRFVVVDPRNGQVLDYVDLLASIQAEIAARGLPYAVVAVQENTSGALPLAIDFSAGQVSKALAFTDRVVALRRTDVTVTDTDQGLYAARIPLGPLDVTRGWIRFSGEHDGLPFHFVTTHLETQAAAPVQAGQAAELLGSVTAGLEGLTILVGDLNSDAAGAPGSPSWTPTYDAALAAGFVDAWTQSAQHPRDPGLTCCQEPDLLNGPSVLDQRLDLVLVRAGDDPASPGRIPGAMSVELVGEEQSDRTASGLWPSDHAGVVAGLRLPRGLLVNRP